MLTHVSSSGGEDLARGKYSDTYPPPKVAAPLQYLKDVGEDTVGEDTVGEDTVGEDTVGEDTVGKTVQVRAWIQNVRMQSAKMAFVELREERSWTIQGVVIASPTGTPVSRQMVKWVGGLLQLDYFIRGQEILTGGQRIHLPEVLESRIRAKGIDPSSPGIEEYLDVFKSAGVPPHGGGGIGLDRVVAWFVDLPTVHLASYYPRTPKTLVP